MKTFLIAVSCAAALASGVSAFAEWNWKPVDIPVVTSPAITDTNAGAPTDEEAQAEVGSDSPRRIAKG